LEKKERKKSYRERNSYRRKKRNFKDEENTEKVTMGNVSGYPFQGLPLLAWRRWRRRKRLEKKVEKQRLLIPVAVLKSQWKGSLKSCDRFYYYRNLSYPFFFSIVCLEMVCGANGGISKVNDHDKWKRDKKKILLIK